MEKRPFPHWNNLLRHHLNWIYIYPQSLIKNIQVGMVATITVSAGTSLHISCQTQVAFTPYHLTPGNLITYRYFVFPVQQRHLVEIVLDHQGWIAILIGV